MIFTILVFAQIALCLAMIALVLLQQGKGAEAGAALTGGAQTILGAAGGGNPLTRATAILATLFIINSLALATLSKPTTLDTQSIILDADTSDVPTAPTFHNDGDTPTSN